MKGLRYFRWRDGLVFLLVGVGIAQAAQAQDLWGQDGRENWVWQQVTSPGDLAGTWWEGDLVNGTTYTMTFNLNAVRGVVRVYFGDREPLDLPSPGPYSFDFTANSKKRLMFRAEQVDGGGIALLDATQIFVTEKTDAPKIIRKGHYISFGDTSTVNLETKMASPQQWAQIESHLTSPGVKGVWTPIDWKDLETADGQYDWTVIEDNLAVAAQYGLRLIVSLKDKNFEQDPALIKVPGYFPSQYIVPFQAGQPGLSGYFAKRWDPYVYTRMIRLYRAVAARYDSHPNFEGVATSESSLGTTFDTVQYEYNLQAYEKALTNIANCSKGAFYRSRLFLYINDIRGGTRMPMENDSRGKLLSAVANGVVQEPCPFGATPSAGGPFVIGGADVLQDHQYYAVPFYLWAEDEYDSTLKSCHNQYVDYRQKKSNQKRVDFQGAHGVYPGASVPPDEILRNPNGNEVNTHPEWVLDSFWTPQQTFDYARENLGCNYYFWHYKPWQCTNVECFDKWGTQEYRSNDALPVIATSPPL